MAPIKIFYVIGTLDVGGTEQQLVRLVTRLDRARFAPVVCCLAAGGALERELRYAGVDVHVLGFRGISPARLLTGFPRAARELTALVRLIRAESPDIVHGFLFWAYVFGAFAARAASVPVVIASRRSLSLFKGGRLRFLIPEQIANRLTTLFIANSEAVRHDAIQTERIRPEKIMTIYNGIATSPEVAHTKDFKIRHRIAASAPVIAVVANFIAYKGHDYFLEAWRQVLQRCPNAVAVLAGDGPVRASIEGRAEALGLGASLRFLGRCADIPSVLHASDMLVHPSLQEGFSNAIIEAMAAGRPVIATAVGGNPEAVVEGATGILVPPADAGAVAAAIVRLIENRYEGLRMGIAGRARAVRYFDIDVMVRSYEAVYERMVAGSQVRAAVEVSKQVHGV